MSRITQLAKNLYEHRDKSGDVTFIVEAKRIRAHRNVLAVNSEKYEAQFFGPKPDEGDIQVDGVSSAAFEEFLKLFYFDEVDFSIEHIGDVLDLAKQSLVNDFVTACIDFLKRNLTIDNLCSIYRLANSYDLEELKELCEQKISKNTKALFDTEDFANCDQETLIDILKLNSLNCAETEVFDACISWARADCDRNQIDKSNAVNLRTALGDAIHQVRFGSMALKEFLAHYKSLEGFFSKDEYIEITHIIAECDDSPSQKFNRTRREQTNGFLECNRVCKQLQPPLEIMGGSEELNFQCNKTIRWHGFVINSDSATGVTVSMKEPENSWKVPKVSIEKKNNEVVVTLVEPVDVKPNASYGIFYKANNPKFRTFHHTYDSGEVESNDTIFRFYNNSLGISSISRLLFTKN